MRQHGTPQHPARVPADLTSWAGALNCYTAALAVWLARGQDRWWRPLLSGTPTLTVTPEPDGLMRFEHHPRPLLEMLGLAVRYTADWPAARAAFCTELDRYGAIVICGDTYNLPWQRGHRRWHTPHWFTVVRLGSAWLVDDPLQLTTPAGQQDPRRVPVTVAQLEQWSLAPPSLTPVHRLREAGVVGHGPPGTGMPYRWLAPGPALPGVRPNRPSRTGPDAVDTLAAHLRRTAPGQGVHEQADDLWHALRQRELLLTAADEDPGLVEPDVREHWRTAISAWRRIPPLFMYARLRAQSGSSVDPAPLADAVAAVAGFEGSRWQVGGAPGAPGGDDRWRHE